MKEEKVIMVIDDEAVVRNYLHKFLKSKGYEAHCFESSSKGIESLHDGFTPSAIILDYLMPEMDGIQTLREIKRINSSMPVIFLSAYNDAKTVVKALKYGAQDFILKPFKEEELENAIEKISPLKETVTFDYFITGSKKMDEIKAIISRINNTDLTVLIEGETGVGKEVVARAIHYGSSRSNKPLIKINCAALPQELLESELFGYEQGAFTGALKQKPGKFELANSGTIFLDEIGEMSPSVQGKLLQVLQDEEFSRLGGKRDIRVDVRVVAATNRNLEKALREGTFREDLYYRLSMMNIYIPPLRERKDEIPLLCDYFIEKYSDKYDSQIRAVPKDLMQLFMEYDWLGNVRELENLIKRLLALGDIRMITNEIRAKVDKKFQGSSPETKDAYAQHIQTEIPSSAEQVDSNEPNSGHERSLKRIGKLAVKEAEREVILEALQKAGQSKSEASKLLGISYKALLYKIKQCGIETESKNSLDIKRIAKVAMQKAEREVILEALEKADRNKMEASKLLGISYKALLYKIKQCGIEVEAKNNFNLKKISKLAMQRAEREVILEALQKVERNKTEAAKLLGISYKALLYKIKQCGIEMETNTRLE